MLFAAVTEPHTIRTYVAVKEVWAFDPERHFCNTVAISGNMNSFENHLRQPKRMTLCLGVLQVMANPRLKSYDLSGLVVNMTKQPK